MSLREAWDEEARAWIRFSGEPDVYAWRFNLPAFLKLVPRAGRLTVDVGCGEGRVARVLQERGHRVIGIDPSPTLVDAARAGEPPVDARVADAADMPLGDGEADLAIAFMTLQSVDDVAAVVAETGRVLGRGGRLCAAVVHPMNSMVYTPGGYFDEYQFSFEHERDGVEITFHDYHHPLETYTEAIEDAGLVIDAVREPIPGRELLAVHPSAERWIRSPCFLHLRARKP